MYRTPFCKKAEKKLHVFERRYKYHGKYGRETYFTYLTGKFELPGSPAMPKKERKREKVLFIRNGGLGGDDQQAAVLRPPKNNLTRLFSIHSQMVLL